jgi:hypothetical protein
MVAFVESRQVFDLFFMMAMAHCVADYPLQTDRIALEKCPGCQHTLHWGWWLAAHAGTHAFFVGWITGHPVLGLAEWFLHGIIDLCKCRKWYNLAVDQALHLACKSLWAIVTVFFMAPLHSLHF